MLSLYTPTRMLNLLLSSRYHTISFFLYFKLERILKAFVSDDFIFIH